MNCTWKTLTSPVDAVGYFRKSRIWDALLDSRASITYTHTSHAPSTIPVMGFFTGAVTTAADASLQEF